MTYETIRIRNDATEEEYITAVRIARRACAVGYETVVADDAGRIFWYTHKCWKAMTDVQRDCVRYWYDYPHPEAA